MSPDRSPLAIKLNAFIPLSSGEFERLAQIQSAPIHVKRGKEIAHEGQTGEQAFILQAGILRRGSVAPQRAGGNGMLHRHGQTPFRVPIPVSSRSSIVSSLVLLEDPAAVLSSIDNPVDLNVISLTARCGY